MPADQLMHVPRLVPIDALGGWLALGTDRSSMMPTYCPFVTPCCTKRPEICLTWAANSLYVVSWPWQDTATAPGESRACNRTWSTTRIVTLALNHSCVCLHVHCPGVDVLCTCAELPASGGTPQQKQAVGSDHESCSVSRPRPASGAQAQSSHTHRVRHTWIGSTYSIEVEGQGNPQTSGKVATDRSF